MKVITVTNQKGGTGKTSTALFLTYGLAHRGKKVLLIDLDQQADASFSMHVDYDQNKTTFEVLTGDAALKDIIVKVNDNIDLAPASSKLAELDVVLTQKVRIDPQYILKDTIKNSKVNYDYIVIDTPPALSEAVLNALTASNTVLVPTQADIYSLKGLGELAQTIAAIKNRSNPDLEIAGILIGRFNKRTVFAKSISKVLESAAEQLHTKVFKSRIREATAVKESQNAFESIYEYDPRGKVTEDVNNFIGEFLQEN